MSNTGFEFKNCILSSVRVNDRSAQGKKNLTFVQVISSNFQPSPSLLYFGEQPIEHLMNLVQQHVNVSLVPGNQGFTVESIDAVK